MSTLHLHSRRDVLAGLVAAATATVALLGGATLLFAEAGRTPWFEPGSLLAQEASRCEHALSVSARHRCLRELVDAYERDAVRSARTAPDVAAP